MWEGVCCGFRIALDLVPWAGLPKEALFKRRPREGEAASLERSAGSPQMGAQQRQEAVSRGKVGEFKEQQMGWAHCRAEVGRAWGMLAEVGGQSRASVHLAGVPAS